jgi:hypothetical protein
MIERGVSPAGATVATDMEPNLLDPRHPSFSTERATFMFALTDRAGAPRKFILVEANNRWAVQAVEWVLGDGQAVSPTCRCMAIFRDLQSLGTRDDMLEEVPYADFMIDMVDPERLAQIEDAFNRSLTDEERDYVNDKLAADAAPVPAVSGVLPAAPSSPASDDEEKLVSALTKLGFSKKPVMRFVDSVRPRIGRDDIRLLIKDGCKALVA